jgi:hypothetical protein
MMYNWVCGLCPSPHIKTETDLEFRTMDKTHEPIDTES